MRVSGTPRLESAVPQGSFYINDGVPPHGLTQRASYTVPTGKMVRIDGASISIACIQTPGTPGLVKAYINQSAANILYALWQYDGVYAAPLGVAIGSAGYLGSGQVISIYTADGSTGGAMAYAINIRFMVMS